MNSASTEPALCVSELQSYKTVPELGLLLGHGVHQDLQAMPPHPTALLMKVKGHVPAGRHEKKHTHTHTRSSLSVMVLGLFSSSPL